MAPFDKASWAAVSSILNELLDSSAAQRAARLPQLQAQDPELAERVAALLAGKEAVEEARFLEGAAFDPLAIGTLAGRSIGVYTLDRPLGQGGMGSVWLARRSDGQYEGSVAIKFLNLALLGRGGAERLRREANVLAKLSHPNITRLIDAGVAAGQPYLVLEYVEGEPIDRWCDAQSLDVAARVRVFLQVLEAVAHAHGRLILHRDLKPSNILVTADGCVKLLDFGIAKLLEGEGKTAPPTELTQLGGPALTPDYAAPEQALPAEVTTATDVYALGVLLYVLLVGAHPTAGATRTPIERLRALIDAEPVRLSEAAQKADPAVPQARGASPQQLVRALRGDLENILGKALKKAPNDRYATVDAFAEDLQRHLSQQPVSARADSRTYRMGKFVRRHRVAVGTAAGAVLTLIAISAVALWQMVEANRQREAAEQQAARANSSQYFLYSLLSDTGMSGRPFTTLELLAQAEKMIDSQFGSREHENAIEQLLQIAQMYASLGEQTKSLELVQAAHRRAVAAGQVELSREAACTLGRQLYLTGRPEDGVALLDQTIDELRPRAQEASTRELVAMATLVNCLQARSDVHLSRGDFAAGVAAGREAVALSTEAFRAAPLAQISPRMQLAIALRVAGERKQADDAYQDLFDLFQRLGRDHSVDAIVLLGNWSKLKSDVGDVLGAARLLESALGAGQALRPDGTSDHMLSMNYAQTSLLLHRLDQAERYFSVTRRGAREERDAEYELISLLGLAAVARERGDLAAASARLEEAREFARAQLPPQHRTGKLLLLETGQFHLAANSLPAAAAVLSELVTEDASVNAKMPRHAVALSAWAQVELRRGDVKRAEALAKRASAVAAELALPDRPSYWVGRSLLVESRVEMAAGRAEAARRLAAQSVAQLKDSVGPDHPLTRNAAALASSATL